MKQTIITSIVAALIAVIVSSPVAQAGLWTALSGMFAETIESQFFAVEAQGVNIRGYLYELKPIGKTCVFNATEGGSGGLSCFDTPKEVVPAE